MPQADAKKRFFAGKQFFYCGNGVIACLRVAWSIGKKNAVWIESQYGFGWGICWDDGQAAAALCEHSQNVGFYTKIICHHVILQVFRLPETLS